MMGAVDSVARLLALSAGNGGSEPLSYNDLENKPQINGTTLTGNKTLDELGITAGNLNAYTKEETISAINDVTDDKADKTALGNLSDLVTDDKSSAVAAINEIKERGTKASNIDNLTITENENGEIQAVGVLNDKDKETLVKLWTGTKAEYDAIEEKDDATLYNITDDYEEPEIVANKTTIIDANSTDTQYPSAKAVYDKIKESTPDLSNYVKNTNYATYDKAGVLRANSSGFNVGTDGIPRAEQYDLDNYKSIPNNTFISKGTLENIKDDYVGTSEPINVLNDTLDNIVSKQTATDSIININDALKYKNFDFKVDGAYEQKTTTGKQLYNVKDKSEVYNDITVDDDDWITINIDNTSGSSSIYANYYTNNLNLKANTNYNVFLEVKNISGTGNLRIISYFYQGEVQTEGQFITYWNYDLTQLQSNKIYNKIATTVSEEIMQTIKSDGLRTFFEVPAGQSGSVTFRISVIEDTTKTPENFVYEPYTGGIATPNPDYIQEITSLNFDKIMTSGQNLFDINDIAGDNVTNNNFIKTTVDDDDFIHVEINNTNGSFEVFANYWTAPSKKLLPNHDYLVAVEVKEYNGNGYNNYVGAESVTQFKTGIAYRNQKTGIFIKKITTKDSFTAPYTMLRSFIQCPANSKVSITYRISILADLTVNQENFVYKPYQAIDYSINLQGNEIVALPNGVKDELTIDKEGNVSLVKKVGKILLNSVEKWDLIGDTENYWEYANYNLSDSAKYSYCLSNYFSSDEDNRLIYTLTEIYCRFPKSLGIDVSDTEKFKQWLSSNNVYGYYEKTTPQTVSLGKLSDLITTEQGSNTFAINGNIDTNISTTYALDLKKYIDNKIAAISSAVLEQE